MLMPSWKKAQKVFTKISIHRLQQSLESNVPRQWNQSPTGSCASCAQLDILSATEVGGSPTPVHTWAHIENVFYTHGRTWANPETARDKGGNPVAGNNTGDPWGWWPTNSVRLRTTNTALQGLGFIWNLQTQPHQNKIWTARGCGMEKWEDISLRAQLVNHKMTFWGYSVQHGDCGNWPMTRYCSLPICWKQISRVLIPSPLPRVTSCRSGCG